MSALMKIRDVENLLGKERYLVPLRKADSNPAVISGPCPLSPPSLCQELVQERDTYLSNDI